VTVFFLALLGCEAIPPLSSTADLAVVETYASPLRRLTSSQYDNTVRDLFIGVDLPSQEIVADPDLFGFDNNGAAQYANALYVEQIQQAATEVTSLAVATPGWLPCPIDGGADPLACGHQVLTAFLPRAYRRPVTDTEREALLEIFDGEVETEGFEVALQLALQVVLNSPDFLYFPEFGGPYGRSGHVPLTSVELASRLSYFLWNTMPDEALLAAAATGELDTADGVEAQVWRMLEDPRAGQMLQRFHHQWMRLDGLDAVEPDPLAYPAWTTTLRASMAAETHAFVAATVAGETPTLARLLTGTQTSADVELAAIYAIDAEAIQLPADERAGVLTRAAWLTATSHAVHPSPVQRGVFVLENLLCVPVSSPPADVDTLVPDAQEVGTNRERYAQHTADPACSGCHSAIDPLGFGFENYDSIGRHRIMDFGVRVDASGVMQDGDLAGLGFDDAVSMSHLLADSRTVLDCYARNWLRYAHGEDLPAGSLGDAFAATGGQLPQLWVDIARSERFRSVR
jgi:hypothetical protein